MKKNIYIMMLDITIISIPVILYFNLSNILLEWITVIDYILLTWTCLSIFGAIFTNEESVKKIIKEREYKPLWWSKYDLLTDILFIVFWFNINPLTSLLYLISKASIEYRISHTRRAI